MVLVQLSVYAQRPRLRLHGLAYCLVPPLVSIPIGFRPGGVPPLPVWGIGGEMLTINLGWRE